jgi:hypothetical protein
MFEPALALPVRPHTPVSAPGGIELGGVGALFPAFGEGGDIVAPWAKTGIVAESVNSDVAAAMSVVRNAVCMSLAFHCMRRRSEEKRSACQP